MESITHSPEQTEQLGADFAKKLIPGDVVAYSGELGAGKTAFSRGILRGLGFTGRVTSPTFAIANEYQTPQGTVIHCDLYRVTSADALYEIGFSEYLDGHCIVLIEWSERAAALLPKSCKHVHIAYGETPSDRKITIRETPL